MSIIISYLTGKTALAKKQYYIVPVCLLFVFYNILADLIVAPSSFFVKYQKWIMALEIIIFLAFLGGSLYTSIKVSPKREQIITRLFVIVAFLCRVVRIIYLRISIRSLEQLNADLEKYLLSTRNISFIATVLLFLVQLMSFFIMIYFLITLRKKYNTPPMT